MSGSRRAAVIPGAPLLIPELTGGVSAELADLRRAVSEALGSLHGQAGQEFSGSAQVSSGQRPEPPTEPLRVLVGMGGACGLERLDPPDADALDGFGHAPAVRRAGGRAAHARGKGRAGSLSPVGAAVAAHLIAEQLPEREPEFWCVGNDASPTDIAEAGTRCSAGDVLIVADGSAMRGPKPPRGQHPDADTHDATIAAALARGNAQALLELDLEAAATVSADGVPALQALGYWARGAEVRSSLIYHEAPFGVGYFAASWTA